MAATAMVATARAQQKFSQTVRPEDFAAAGLPKLTPEERARLDVLIEAFKGGATVSTDVMAAGLAVAQRAAEAAAVARVAAEARASKAERAAEEAKAANVAAAEGEERKKERAKAEGRGFFAKAKVLLKPGTEIEYEKVETRLLGDFRGWSDGTIFSLENGQRWQVQGGNYSMPPEPGPRRVVIVPGLVGAFFLEIEGVRQKPKVRFVGGEK
ncbi:MAG: hypothetical protein H7343_15700 [Undibacterium sp.]|nr:hypothetical protein [Opitutaceae bacterium]